MVADGFPKSRGKKNSEVVVPKAVVVTEPLNASVMFDFDSDKIREDQVPVIEDITGYVKNNPETIVVIKGYASEEGSESYNTVLSARRATAVEWALMDKGVDRSNIKSVTGEGETTMFGDLLDQNRKVIVVSVDE